jgi:hypothetical protein
MPWNDAPTIHALRMTYNAAVAAHAGCTRALTRVALNGEQPQPDMVAAEAKAKVCLVQAREKLHTAMALAMGGKPKS